MSEVQTGGGDKGKGGKPKAKKMSTHIDMTPMVDLAFLLLTFFMLTTTFSKPKTMEIAMPEKPKDNTDVPQVNEKKVLNLVLAENNRIFAYVGLKPTEDVVEELNYSENSLRKKLFERLRGDSGSMVLIKADDKASYANVVSLFDEMNITKQKRYALIDINDDEKKLLKEKTGTN
ncbi:MAG: biopolymer transporter ExbD [Bacteroidota bacterium]|nr:biopolymer transporter ExbD [Bacteroidota bacterium]